MRISATTQDILEKAGWSPARRIDISEYEQELTALGYVVSPAARSFLQQFGGLLLRYYIPQLPGIEVTQHFNPLLACRVVEPCVVEGFEERAHEQLVPVGEAWGGHQVLMMSPTGRIYGANGQLLHLLGDNYWQVLDALCDVTKARATEIP